jgi:hypothetical protein
MEQASPPMPSVEGGAWMFALKRIAVVVGLATFLTLTAASLAQAQVTVLEGKGVGKARLGMTDTTAAKYLGKHQPIRKDTDYGSRVVYVIYFGTKSGGRFPLEMLSKANHKVFMFTCNASKYVTSKGVKVGSTESALKAAYGSKLKRVAQSIYNRYTLGTHPYTRFWVKRSTKRVSQIFVGA